MPRFLPDDPRHPRNRANQEEDDGDDEDYNDDHGQGKLETYYFLSSSSESSEDEDEPAQKAKIPPIGTKTAANGKLICCLDLDFCSFV